LTRIKDGLVVASLATGVATHIVGTKVGDRIRDESKGDGVISEANRTWRKDGAERRAVRTLGIVNLLANIAILGVTTALAMEGNRSTLFSARSRFLP
jgi:hypothetical protein